MYILIEPERITALGRQLRTNAEPGRGLKSVCTKTPGDCDDITQLSMRAVDGVHRRPREKSCQNRL